MAGGEDPHPVGGGWGLGVDRTAGDAVMLTLSAAAAGSATGTSTLAEVAAEVALAASVIVSAELCEEVSHRSVPIDSGVLRLLRGSPATGRVHVVDLPDELSPHAGGGDLQELRLQFGPQVSTPRGTGTSDRTSPRRCGGCWPSTSTRSSMRSATASVCGPPTACGAGCTARADRASLISTRNLRGTTRCAERGSQGGLQGHR